MGEVCPIAIPDSGPDHNSVPAVDSAPNIDSTDSPRDYKPAVRAAVAADSPPCYTLLLRLSRNNHPAHLAQVVRVYQAEEGNKSAPAPAAASYLSVTATPSPSY